MKCKRYCKNESHLNLDVRPSNSFIDRTVNLYDCTGMVEILSDSPAKHVSKTHELFFRLTSKICNSCVVYRYTVYTKVFLRHKGLIPENNKLQ